MSIFGTDGIRGRANEYPISPDGLVKIAAFLGDMINSGSLGHSRLQKRVVISKDTRESGYMVETALTSGFLSAGIDVILTGPAPTPAVPCLVKSLYADLGVMISASHNQYTDNGVKIFDKNGHKLSTEACADLTELLNNGNLSDCFVDSSKIGRAMRLDDAIGRYVEYVKHSVKKSVDLSGIKVLIDTANGSAYKIAREVLWELGADVVAVANSPDGRNINKDCGSTSPSLACKALKECSADIGIAFDGDADRLVVIDEKGEVINGDILNGAIASYMFDEGMIQGGVVYTKISNVSLDNFLEDRGISAKKTDVGDQNVAQAMKKFGYNIGFEKSGHIIFGDNSYCSDAILATLNLLSFIAPKIREGHQVSRLLRLFDTSPEFNKTIKCSDDFDLATIQSDILQIRAKHENSNIIVRMSGTEKNSVRVTVNILGYSQSEVDAVGEQIVGLIK